MKYKRHYFAGRHSGCISNCNSHLPNTYKKGLIDTLSYRAYNIRSNCSNLYQEINYLKTVWQKNLFLLFFIHAFTKHKHKNLTSAKKDV